MRHFIPYLIALIGFVSCDKNDKIDKIDIIEFWNCNKTFNLDSNAVNAKLVGSWKWIKRYWSLDGVMQKANKNVVIEFKTDGTFKVTENSIIVTHGTWKLMKVDGNLWELDLNSRSEYLMGRILFCGNQVVFYHSYVDGVDTLFTRV